MIFVDDILTYFRNIGHAAEYGTLAQLNEQLTNVDYAASTDGMVAFVRLIGEQRTVDGHDQCDIAVHLSWLCPLDFDGETLLSTQEQAKDTLKAWINHLRGGNTVTVSDDERWQFGYDDFAENVAWVAVRVTLTASAADCVPLSPEPPTPPPGPEYDIFCPQIILQFYTKRGGKCPAYYAGDYVATLAVPILYTQAKYALWVGNTWPTYVIESARETITEERIENWKNLLSYVEPMTEETETWLRERIGRILVTYTIRNIAAGKEKILAAYSATNYESKPVTVYE